MEMIKIIFEKLYHLGRAWSLQFNDDEIVKMPFQIIQIRNEILKKKLHAFVISKGDSKDILKTGSTYNVDIFIGKSFEELESLDSSSSTVCIDQNVNQWHEHLVSLHVNCSIAFYGQRSIFQDILVGEMNDEMVFVKMNIKNECRENNPISEGFKSQISNVLKNIST